MRIAAHQLRLLVLNLWHSCPSGSGKSQSKSSRAPLCVPSGRTSCTSAVFYDQRGASDWQQFRCEAL